MVYEGIFSVLANANENLEGTQIAHYFHSLTLPQGTYKHNLWQFAYNQKSKFWNTRGNFCFKNNLATVEPLMPEELWPPEFQQGIKFRIIY